jgi:hypothetical protein
LCICNPSIRGIYCSGCKWRWDQLQKEKKLKEKKERKSMFKTYKSKVTLNGKEKVMVVVNYNGEEKKVENKKFESVHYLHILDRSGSMDDDICDLIENVKLTIPKMDMNDFVSIIWFSGSGQYKTLIKGARPDASLLSLLDSIKSTIGMTCFSEALAEAQIVIEDLHSMCSNIVVSLFTDGETVTMWSEEEEERRIFEVINGNETHKGLKNLIIALNTIGYGSRYNRDLLFRMASSSQFGTLTHSEKIKDYLDIFSKNYEIISGMTREKLYIETSDFIDILYLGSRNTKLSKGTLELDFLDKKKNQIVLISDDDFNFVLNDELLSSVNIESTINIRTRNNILYAYAYELFYNDRRRESLEILARVLGDKQLVDKQTNVFTFSERAEYEKVLKDAVFIRARRDMGSCKPDYIPADDAFCLFDLFNILMTGENFYVPNEATYQRIGLKVTDNYNIFKQYKDREIRAPFNEFTFNADKLNMSIRFMKEGVVEYNPKQARSLGLPEKMEVTAFRFHTLIKDGTLNVKSIKVLIEKDTLYKLGIRENPYKNNKVTLRGDILNNGIEYYEAEFDLTLVPIINKLYAENSKDIIRIHTLTMDELELECRQKVLNYLIGRISEGGSAAAKKAHQYSDFNNDQIEFLKNNGISSKLVYNGIDNKKAEKGEDFYIARELSFGVKGSSSIPSIDEVIKKMKAIEEQSEGYEKIKFNYCSIIISDYIKKLKSDMETLGMDIEKLVLKNRQLLEDLSKEVKNRLTDIRVKLNSSKIALVLTGYWFEGLEEDEKKKDTYYFSHNGSTLVIKTNKVKVYY